MISEITTDKDCKCFNLSRSEFTDSKLATLLENTSFWPNSIFVREFISDRYYKKHLDVYNLNNNSKRNFNSQSLIKDTESR